MYAAEHLSESAACVLKISKTCIFKYVHGALGIGKSAVYTLPGILWNTICFIYTTFLFFLVSERSMRNRPLRKAPCNTYQVPGISHGPTRSSHER